MGTDTILQNSFKSSVKDKPMKAITPRDPLHFGYPISLKEGVVFKALRPEIYGILDHVSMIFDKYDYKCIITSAHDGVHKGYRLYRDGNTDPLKISKHYQDLAIDLRTKHIAKAETKKEIAEELALVLGDEYLVLLEYSNEDNEHIHIGLR